MKELPLLFSSLLCPNVRFIQWRIARGDVINQIYPFQWNDGDGISWLFVSEGRIQNLSQEDRQIHRITVNPVITVHNSSCGKGNVFTSVCQEFCPQGWWCTFPWADTPLGRQPPPPRRSLQRTVHILLECILVSFYFLKNYKIKEMFILEKEGSTPGALFRSATGNECKRAANIN